MKTEEFQDLEDALEETLTPISDGVVNHSNNYIDDVKNNDFLDKGGENSEKIDENSELAHYLESIHNEFSKDVELTIGNLKDKSLLEAQIKGKWASKLMSERVKGKVMKRNLDLLIEKLTEMYDKSESSFISSKMQKDKAISSNSEVLKLRRAISDNRQVQDMMEMYWEVIKGLGFTIKNSLEALRLELGL